MSLAKLAASLDARRSKQYWQLLKRLYGGNDEAIQAIKETGDHNIYHGTSAQNADSILREGFRGDAATANDTIYGSGTYFGNRERGEHYSKDGGSLLRFAKPSELRGGKTLYPSTQKMVKFDPADPTAQLNAQNQGHMFYAAEATKQPGFMESLMNPESEGFKKFMGASQHLAQQVGLAGEPAAHQTVTYGKIPSLDVSILLGQMLSKHEHIPPELIRKA